MRPPVAVSVVVCTRNRAPWLRWCLSSLAEQSLKATEVLIVDSSDEGVNRDASEACLAGCDGTRYVRSGRGLTRQRNAGVALSRGDIVLFIDDDVVLHPDYLEMLVGVFQRDPRVAGVGGRIVNESARSKLDTFYRRLFTIADNKRSTVTLSGDAGHLFEFEGVSETSALSGCNMAFRRAVFARGLRFDEQLRGYGFMEDVLFSLEAGAYGPLVQISSAIAFHGYRLKDRWGPMYVENQITHAAYVFARTRKLTRASRVAFAWRTLGRLIHAMLKSGKERRWDVALASIRGACRAFASLSIGERDPIRVLMEGNVRKDE